MQTIYPDPRGYITLWTLQDQKTYWLPAENTEKIIKLAAELCNKKNDVYFGVGLASEPRKPTKNNPSPRTNNECVTFLPGLWFDFDIETEIKHNVPISIEKAVEFIESSIPFQPTILIDSGHGLHGYWLFKELWDITEPEERLKAADVLSRFQDYILNKGLEQGYKFDKTADLARVLRLPETINYKSIPVPVKIYAIDDTERYNPTDYDSFLPESSDADYMNTCGGLFETRKTDGLASFTIDNCAFIQYCRDNAKTLSETFWNAMITNIARAKDGHEMCHELSQPYPKYSSKETDKKYARARNNPKGPQGCQYIQSLGFHGCPAGGCGVKNPITWSLSPKKRKKTREPYSPFDTQEKPKGSKYNLTDLGNAERFANMFTDQIKYCSQFGKWLLWDGRRWAIDDTEQIMKHAKKCVRSMYADAGEIDDYDQRKSFLQHANRSESLARMSSMITLARHMLAVTVDELDADPWLLNVLNGTLNLKTGKIQPHDPSNNITKLAPITYDPAANPQIFHDFIRSVFAENENVIQFMQRFLGYCLTGDTREQKFMIAWGSGQNGKGTLLNLILDILGDNAETTPADTIMAKKSEGIPNDIARLRGARYVLASETQKGRRMNEALVTQMTGQDRMAARFLHQEFFEFWPQFKIVLLTNDKPNASGDASALWRRIMLTPFTQKFEGAKCDNTLREKLRHPAEMAGVFRWLVDGCLAWQKNGLQPPDEVIQATTDYRNENDVLGDWLEENCIIGNYVTGKIADLYKNFEEWSLNNGEKHFFNKKKFSQYLAQKGYELYKGTAGVRSVRGVGLLDTKHAPIPGNTRNESDLLKTGEEPF